MKTALVLAGGRGTRLRPLTDLVPKPMVRLGDRPILEFVLAVLRSSGVKRVLFLLHYRPAPIVAHFGDGGGFGLDIDYLVQGGDLGTAGGVRQTLGFLEDRDFVVASADVLFHASLAEAEDLHRARRADATLALSVVEDASQFGLVERGPGGRIVEFHEKPCWAAGRRGLVNAGLYVLNRKVLARVPAERPFDFGRDLFPGLARDGGAIFGWELPGYWRDLGTPSALGVARQDVRDLPVFKEMVTRWPASQRGLGGRIWIHPGSPAKEWLEMDITTIGQATGVVWRHLAERKEGGSTLEEIQKLKGLEAREALAALGWLAREGKLEFPKNGAARQVRLAPAELAAQAR